MSVSVALGEMDSWVEEEIARELEKMGIEDIESIEEEEILDHSIDHALPISTSTDTSSTFNIHKYQTLQASCWDGLEDILSETRTILNEEPNVHHLIHHDTEKLGDTYEVDRENVILVTDHQPNWKELSLLSENQTSTVTILSELKEKEQMEKNQIMKQIEDKDREIQELANKRKQYRAKLEEDKREHQLYLQNKSCTVIQSYWRGYRSRKLVENMKKERNIRRTHAATLIQSNWKKCYQLKNNKAAITIQQCWKHYRCRKIVQCILGVVRENAVHSKADTKQVNHAQEEALLTNHDVSSSPKSFSSNCTDSLDGHTTPNNAPIFAPSSACNDSQPRSDDHKPPQSTPGIPICLIGQYKSSHHEDKQVTRTQTPSSLSSVWGSLKISNRELVQKALHDSESTSAYVPSTSSSQPSVSPTTPNTDTQCTHNQPPVLPTTSTCRITKNNTTTPSIATSDQFTSKSSDVYLSNTFYSPHTVPDNPKKAVVSPPMRVSKSCPCVPSKTPNFSNKEKEEPVSFLSDEVPRELQDLIALKESWSKEEHTAQLSRIRMSKMFSTDQILRMAAEVRKRDTYATRLEHAATPLSPSAWAGLILERLESWQKARQTLESSICSSKYRFYKRTPTISSNCVALSEDQILAFSPPGTPINKVTLVNVTHSDISVDLTCLSQCHELRSLRLAECGLNSFCDIGKENSKLLEALLPYNLIDTIDLCQFPSLAFLDLSENRMGSIHGINHCSNLFELIIDENRIARIGDMRGCEKLQKLSLVGNLIIDAEGITPLHNLQHLLLAENHLTSLNSIDNCLVLQIVKLRQNNLQMCPSFTNHCLLRELTLSENCLSDIDLLEQAWLPLLQTLDLANNCICSINSLVCCIKLKYLNVEQNFLYDLPCFLQSVRGCYDLRELSTGGNPIENEPKYRKIVLKALPGLKMLNGNPIGINKKVMTSHLITDNPLYKLCGRQIDEQDMMKIKHLENIRDLNKCTSKIKCPLLVSSLLERKVNDCEEYEDLLRCHLREQAMFDGTCQVSLYEKIKIKRHNSAVIIQAYWRSYRARRKYRLILRSVLMIQRWWRRRLILRSILTIQRWWKRKHYSHTVASPDYQTPDRRSQAATVIQARYRGYALRKKLRMILAQIDQEQAEMAIDENEEVDIPLDESLLSDDYDMRPFTPTDEDLSKYMSQYKRKSTAGVRLPRYVLPGASDELARPTYTRGPLLSPHGGLRDGSPVSTELQPLPPLIQKETMGRRQQKRASLPLEPVTGNVEPISDWNFNSPETAELMKKRAQRLQKQERMVNERIKLSDPSERLAMFRKTQNKSGKERSPSSLAPSPPRKKSTEEFEWSHEKKVVHRELMSSASSDRRHSHHQPISPASTKQRTEQHSSMLPQLEPHVLAGHTPRLVTAAVQNQLAIQKQLESQSLNKTKQKTITESVSSSSRSSLSSIRRSWSNTPPSL